MGCLVLLVVLILLVGISTRLARPGTDEGPSWFVGLLLLVAVLVTTVVLVSVAVLVVRRVARWLSADATVERLIDAAGRVQEGDYSARVPETGSAESRLLARSFNEMSARLGATDAQRRSFMADVSHELRTPLTVIQGQLEAIRDGVYPADAEHLAPALDQVAVLERLVEDLRTLSLSESGSLRLDREPVDLGALVTEVVESFRATADAAGVSLSSETGSGLPRAWLDPARMGGVLRNLVANALRYTPPGGAIVVGVERAHQDHLALVVRDSGSGIDPTLLPTVFERFSRSSDSSGSGLGLAIARSIVEAHRGTITAASVPGAGTTMTVRLPIGPV